ncbi:MAG: 3-isopropylmalate dehydratase small subunit [Elusimicrobiota bacterium]
MSLDKLKGLVHKFGDDISTDLICPGKYFHLRSNIPKLAEHTLEDADENFVEKMTPGDFVVGGNNFGCGSSREHAPLIIKESGVSAVLAKSFARIFYRNAINIGLPVMECDTDKIKEGDLLIVRPKEGLVINKTRDIELKSTPLIDVMLDILKAGGLKEYVKKEGF